MNIGDFQNALIAWVAASVGVANTEIIWDEPTGPKALNPSVRLFILSGPRQLGRDEFISAGANFRQIGPRAWTLALEAIGDDAMQIITNVVNAANSIDDAMGVLTAAGISILSTGSPKSLPRLLQTKYEPRCVVDIELLSMEDVTRDLGSIESAAIAAEVGEYEHTFHIESP
jgi:hypothetical protein